MNRKYYEAYEERYKTVHARESRWSSEVNTPIVLQTIEKYRITADRKILEIGCGEGRDSKAVLESGFQLMATDISHEAIEFCQREMPEYKDSFRVLDCLSNDMTQRFDFIFAVAVIHMLVLDEDRNGFYQFIRNHLNPDGIALICTMGDGKTERQSDVSQAFTLQERDHDSGRIMVAGTSCRMVSFDTFEKELKNNGLRIDEKGITVALPDFDSLMYSIVTQQ